MAADDDLILYVDDEHANRVVFEHAFSGAFHIRALSSGAEALALLESQPVGVLVTDQRMPDMTGNELLREVKDRYPHVIRIIVTAYSDFDRLQDAVNEGLVARYVVKPWDMRELEGILRWALEASTLARENSALQLRLVENERLATIGSFAASILHDVSQPIMGLSTNADHLTYLAEGVAALGGLLERHGDELEVASRDRLVALVEDLPEVLMDVQEATHLLEEIVGQLRGLVNPRRGEVEGARDPRRAIAAAMRLCESIAVRAHTSLVYEGPEELPAVALPETSLTQVLVNLIANGVAAIETAERPKGRVRLHAMVKDDDLQLEVHDNGTGMPPKVLQSVGSSFFSTKQGGTGLGVAASRRLVEAAGGHLRFQSTDGAGTSVCVRLPRRVEAPA